MICKNCNYENDDNAVFCEHCGAKLETNDVLALSTSYRAPLGKRLVASILDSLIASSMMLLLLGIAYMGGEQGEGSFAPLCGMVFAYVYLFVKDGFKGGQSWGKKAVGLMVIHLSDGKPCTVGQSAVRALITLLLNLTIIGGVVEPLMVLITDNGRRLADRAAGTQVIEKQLLNS
ncbi:MAG: RDD family protein [Paludibacteraceae bacterium]